MPLKSENVFGLKFAIACNCDYVQRRWSHLIFICLTLHVFLTRLTMLESNSNLVYWTHFRGTGIPCSLSVQLPTARITRKTRTGRGNAFKSRNEVHVGVSGKSHGLAMQYFGDVEPFLRAETRRSKTVSRATGRYAAASFDQLLVCSRSLFEGAA